MQDAHVFVSESDAGTEHSIPLAPGRQAYLVNVEGSVSVNGAQLASRDAMAIVADEHDLLPVSLQAGSDGCHFLLLEMANASASR